MGRPSPTLQSRIVELHSVVEKWWGCWGVIMNRVETRVEEEEDAWRWCMVRVLVEEGLYHLYTYETEKANPFFMRAMKCEWCDE